MRVGRRTFLAGLGAAAAGTLAKVIPAAAESRGAAPEPPGAHATARVTPGQISYIEVIVGGCGYTSAPAVILPAGRA